jgi:pilus assembly protein CpaF
MSLKQQVLLDMFNRELRPLAQWLDDPEVTEIFVNPGGRVFVERGGEKFDKGVILKEHEIVVALIALSKIVNKDALPNTEGSLVSASVNDMRISGAIAPVSPDGSFMTIRKHRSKGDRPTLEALINEKKALTQEQANRIVDLIINQKKNCVFAGGTGSGKTTLINAVLSRLPKHERVLLIEDAMEINVELDDCTRLLTNAQFGLTARKYAQAAMRFSPERVILGETRGDDTFDLFRLLNSGHAGSMTSVHANSALLALDALEILYQQSLPANANFTPETVRRTIGSVVDVVVYLAKTTMEEEGAMKIKRGVREILLINGVNKDGFYDFKDITNLDP